MAKTPSLVPPTAQPADVAQPEAPAEPILPPPDPDVALDEVPTTPIEKAEERLPPPDRVVFMCDKFPSLTFYCDRGKPGIPESDINPYGVEGRPPWTIRFVDGMFPGPGRKIAQRDIDYIHGVQPYEASKAAPYYAAGVIYDPSARGTAALLAQINGIEQTLKAQGLSPNLIAQTIGPLKAALDEKRRKSGEPEIVHGPRTAGPQPRRAPILTGNKGPWEGISPRINQP